MSRRFRLAGVLRARKAQEDIAKGALARANAATATAVARRDEREQLLLAGPDPDDDITAAAYMATLASRQAMAAELALANQLISSFQDAAGARVVELTDAAINHRSLEKLAERHLAEGTRTDLADLQRDLDETAAARRPANRGDLL